MVISYFLLLGSKGNLFSVMLAVEGITLFLLTNCSINSKSKLWKESDSKKIETSSEILKNLIGAAVNSSSISAIVNDLSKRNRNKYYDN